MIFMPKICGTCHGSQNAVDMVYKLYEEESKKKHPKRIVIYKEILHNEQLIKDLEKKNIRCVDNLTDINTNDIVIIRAHGESKTTYEYLEKNKIEYYDATCPNVLRIHDIITQKYYQNYEIVIIGKKNKDGSLHSEIEGDTGWCGNTAKIVSTVEEVNSLELVKDNVLIVSQTTYTEELFKDIVTKIKEKYKHKNIEYVNTICHATKRIQKSSLELAKKCDYMVVVGGKNSFNTNELYNVCATVCNSVRVSNLTELYQWLKTITVNHNINVGVTGGASTLQTELDEYKQLIQFYLFYNKEKNLFEREIDKYNQNFLDTKDNKIVYDALQKFVNINSGGKYLRAMLISLGYKLISGKNDNNYLPLAMAYETFQTAILIHDDIFDNADKRRGKDTIPTVYMKELSNNENKKGNELANSLGTCIGDLGFYLANQIILENYQNNPNLYKLIEYYNQVVVKTIKGEIIDVKSSYDLQYKNTKKCEEENVIEIYHLKTSWYTIIGPFYLGCLLAGESPKNLNKYERILDNIGIAFQIKDDIIGIYGDTNYTGKNINSDISEFKQTILYSYVYNQNKAYLNELHKYYGKDNLSEQDINQVKKIFKDSGALAYANEKMNYLFNDSIEQLKNLKLSEEYQNILLGFISYLKIRQK